MERHRHGLAIICFNRPELLERCILSMLNAAESNYYVRILFQQLGDIEVSKVVEKYHSHFDHVIQINQTGNATQNISKNRYLVYSLIFDHLLLETATVLEDDVEISYDALAFSSRIYDKYRHEKFFRAVNFGSGIPRELGCSQHFSKVRYALQGPASLLTKSTWRHFTLSRLIEKSESEIFDGTLEPFIQSGFVIMPNSSRYRDLGISGTHANPNSSTEYFSKLEASWLGLKEMNLVIPVRFDSDQNWRGDCVTYNPRLNTYYRFRSWVIFNSNFIIIKHLLLAIRKTKSLLIW